MYDWQVKPGQSAFQPGAAPDPAKDPRRSSPPPPAPAAKAETGPPAEKKEDPDVEKNRAILNANRGGEGGAHTLTPYQQGELQQQLNYHDHNPAAIASVEAELPGLVEARVQADAVRDAKAAELQQLKDHPPKNEAFTARLEKLEEEVAGLSSEAERRAKELEDREKDRNRMEDELKKARAYVGTEQRGFDLSLPAEPEPGKPFDYKGQQKKISDERYDVMMERDGLAEARSKEREEIARKLAAPDLSEDARQKLTEELRTVDSRYAQKLETLTRREAELTEARDLMVKLRKPFESQRPFAQIAAQHASNDFASVEDVEGKIDDIKDVLAKDEALKASLGAGFEMLQQKYPEFAEGFPRLGYSPDQLRWFEQRIAYLRQRASEPDLKTRRELYEQAARDEAARPKKSPEEEARERREQNIELAHAMSAPGAEQDPKAYILGLEQLKEAAATAESAPAQIEAQNLTVDELAQKERDLAGRTAEMEEKLSHYERSTEFGEHDPEQVEREREEHVRAARERLEVSRALEEARERLTGLEGRLADANRTLEGDVERVDITDPGREQVPAGDVRIEKTQQVLLQALDTNFSEELPAESDRLFNEVMQKTKSTVSLFLDPTATPKPVTVEEARALLKEYRNRLGIHQQFAQPVGDKLQGPTGQRVWHDKDRNEITAKQFGPQLGLTEGQRRVMEEEVEKLRQQIEEMEAAKDSKEGVEEGAPGSDEDMERAMRQKDYLRDLRDRYTMVVASINTRRSAESDEDFSAQISAHQELGSRIDEMAQRQVQVLAQIRRARKGGGSQEEMAQLIARRAELIAEARQLMEEYKRRGDALVGKSHPEGELVPDQVEHLATERLGDDAGTRKRFRNLLWELEEDQKKDPPKPEENERPEG